MAELEAERMEVDLASLKDNPRWTADEGMAALASWRESGLTKRMWSQQHGIPAYRLSYWQMRLQRSNASLNDETMPGFMQVGFAGSRPEDAGVEVLLGGSVRLAIQRGFDAATLRRVLEVLR